MFWTTLKKEFTLVFRDIHSVLVLFVMPVVFIIIMSLAMQEQLSSDSDIRVNLKLSHSNNGYLSLNLINELSKNEFLNVTLELIATPSGYFSDNGNEDNTLAVISLSDDFDKRMAESKVEDPVIHLWLAPNVDSRTRVIIVSAIKEAYMKVLLSQQFSNANLGFSGFLSPLDNDVFLKTDYAFNVNDSEQEGKVPSSVQQSVPAWLIFSMFFVVIPLSTTLVTERQQGTLLRLRSMNFSINLFLLAKLVPYLLINQVQLILMLLVGRYLIPLFGGEYLMIGDEYFAIALVSLAVGFSAVGFALLIAVVVKTTEQATSIGGVSNILLAAIGGIMVPKFIMPEYLQDFTNISPMAWGLEGFLDIFLRNSGVNGILTEVGGLMLFGLISLTLAFIVFHRQANN
ncbi:Domain of unknown function / Efflux ABC transporter, permease protein [hydrothermal vent metagenome]|uniref:ABC transmembrane type-2 domain-containing protein n=1 Tax=hydrothermal vent metagenome TaxID=652676 RepID=A0A3B0W0R3_9ZZZZ